MALDGVFLRHLKKELNEIALNSRISQIYQPSKNSLIFNLRTVNGNKSLILSANANSPRIHITNYPPDNPKVPPMLCMLFRKYLNGGKITKIYQEDLERILFLNIDAYDEIGDINKYKIAVEIMGHHSNIILMDSEDLIIDAVKRVDITVSSQRMVLPNLKYQMPPPQKKISLLSNESKDVINKIIKKGKEVSISKGILNSIQGISPIIAREIKYKAMLDDEVTSKNITEIQKENLTEGINNLKDITINYLGKPYGINHLNGKPLDIAFTEIKQYGNGAKVEAYENFSECLDEFYTKRHNQERIKGKSQDINKLLSNVEKRLRRKISLQERDFKKSKNREKYRRKGDLLQANLYRVERGSSSIEVENFYSENNEIIKINLDPSLSPATNAQNYYKKYRKAKTAEKILKEQIKKAEEELKYIGAVQDMLSRANKIEDLEQIRYELIQENYIKRKSKRKTKAPKSLPFMEYESEEGFKILVGRNNRQNDELTFKRANKNDIWLHTKDIHGSHTILVTAGKEPSDEAIIEAAEYAAYHSKGREGSSVPVDYTKVRYVSKPTGAKPGMVTYVNNKTVFVTPKEPKKK